MSARELTVAMIEDGVWEDLQGVDCPFCAARKRTLWGYGKKPKMGHLAATVEGGARGSDVHLGTICYRCQACRGRLSVVHNNNLFFVKLATAQKARPIWSLFTGWRLRVSPLHR